MKKELECKIFFENNYLNKNENIIIGGIRC